MRPFQPLVACFSIVLVFVPASSAQQAQVQAPLARTQVQGITVNDKLNDPAEPLKWNAPGILDKIVSPYRRKIFKPISMADSGRLESLIRAGKIYLSLQDCIALALENNLDIEVARYGPLIADSDILRAKSGGLLRGVQTSVAQGPASVSSQATGGATGGAGGAATATATANTAANGAVITQTGTAIPTFDPILTSSFSLSHVSTPQSNTVTTGTNNLFFGSKAFSAGISEGFATGTNVSYGFNYQSFNNNNQLSTLNPSAQASMSMALNQHLLQGFGLAVNNRNIRIAKINRVVSDLVFEQQVITTVSAVINLYWDLVSFNEDLRVKRQAMELARKLYEDNKKQVEIGTLARIEVTRAEAEMAAREQDMTVSETNVLQQEAVVKNTLTRNGAASPLVYQARIVPTDNLRLNDNDVIQPLSDMMDLALRNRPELKQTELNVESSRVSLSGSRAELLPTLDLQAAISNSGLAGDPNYLRLGQINFIPPAENLVGGFGTLLGQIFRRSYPNYSVGLQLNVPLRNRAAQADYTRDSLTLRQAELRERQQMNQVRLDVQNAQTGLIQIRAQYLAAQKTRLLQEQALDAEQKKYQLGASTIYFVIQAQRDLATAEGSEVATMANYMRARTQMNLVTGQTLQAHNIKLEEARMGSVARPPDIPKP